jgi:hypothetical protein
VCTPDLTVSRAERVVSPPLHELDRLRTPLEPGERLLVDLFHEQLDPNWEIYVQPHLNGLRPDVVLLHPQVGIAVFEVKDWDLEACDWHIDVTRGQPVLRGTDSAGRPFTKPNPFVRLEQYRHEITNLYCPRLGRRAGLACVTAGLVFPFADEHELIVRFGAGLEQVAPGEAAKRYVTLSGSSRRGLDLSKLFPDHQRKSSALTTPELAADLRHWLVEPNVAAEQRRLPRLSEQQEQYIDTRTDSGYRRLRGPAGSGKTMVVAGRAATLAAEGKDVLVVSYNITLLNYLRDCATRFGGDTNNITWLNIHSWCKRTMAAAGRAQEYSALPWLAGGELPDGAMGAAVAAALAEEADLTDRYDAILVDEGQDFHPSWWAALREACRPGGEMLLVADRAQDVYGRNHLWTETAMTGAGFVGPWATLDVTYRLPPALARLMADFVREHLPESSAMSPIVAAQEELDLYATRLRWVQVTEDLLGSASVEAIRTTIAADPPAGAGPVSVADLVFIADEHELGREVVEGLTRLGVRVHHTFAKDQREQRAQKVYFFKGDGRMKATTIHSFKGWEGSHLVIALRRGRGAQSLSAVYTALTRLKAAMGGSSLTVVSAAPELESFGRSWPEFVPIGDHLIPSTT